MMQLKAVGKRVTIAGHKMNMGYCTIPKGNRILKKRGEKDRIVYTHEETANARWSITHNHPGATFSVDDIEYDGQNWYHRVDVLLVVMRVCQRQPAECRKNHSFEKVGKRIF